MALNSNFRRNSTRLAALLATTVLAGLPAAAMAQSAPAAAPAPAPAAAPAAAEPAPQLVRSLDVAGNQRLERDTILSYIRMRLGQPYTQASADQALKDLYATELFSDVQVRSDGNGNVVIQVKENPVINRIIYEGNKRLKEEKLAPEVKLAPRQIFTRSKVRADVARIIELYKRQGRFAATVEPKMVMLDQNRVDIVFEINEGPRSKVRQINIIGNEKFDDGELRSEMLTKQSRTWRLFSSKDSYDPDRLAYDQQKLRQFYLTQGYADFRVVSAVAELTPDKKDFIITYVVEEGQRYKFGDVKVESQLRDFDGDVLAKQLPMKKDDWYNAKLVEDTIDKLNQTAGAFGYAFADVEPNYDRSKEDLTMGITFRIAEAPRVYVEKVEINGNTLTQDKVIRREFRLSEGDAFNSLQVKRSTNRINSLGYFQEKFEVKQEQGSAPDRVVLKADIEEKPTGELQLSAGFSSIESFILQASVQQRNFRGRGQTVGASVSYSRYSKSAQLSFTEPYVFDRNISFGADIYRRDYNNFNFSGQDRNTLYGQTTTGFQMRAGVPLSEYTSLVGRYTFNVDNVTLDENQFYTGGACDPLLAGRYLCDAIGKRTTSSLGLTWIYDTLDNRVRPSRGHTVSLTGEFAGLGGSVKYARFSLNAAKYWPLGKGWIFSVSGEGGIIKGLNNGGDVRLTDRFYLGEPQIRGFDIRGVGPRVLRKPYVDTPGIFTSGSYCYVPEVPATSTTAAIPAVRTAANSIKDCAENQTFLEAGGVTGDRDTWQDDAIGGRYYYLGRMELEIPLGSGAREMGIRPSIFLDAGAVWSIRSPQLTDTADLNGDGVIDNPTGQVFIASRDPQSGLPLYTVTCNGTPTTSGSATAPSLPSTCTGTGDGVIALGSNTAFKEFFLGNSWKPRVAIGIGFNWNSPFGPFRLDFAKTLLKQPGDDTKSFTFNVGTQF
ncbi:outer membrane protein assembly factor BamA [Novosphingobium sp. TH158]|uniref:outer membrane protein assembly factor BamA n=1 Tax=Novosphingobium sp. TH158 TaxID=2067455 RepID=UPI000C799904|nr:outer membrane protein assembly factor BamA [Novosphingobium sp. TH158]PLK25685.1 outer membrane protein assembly factor BamA [Novosphingobium sp. TH158]